MSEDNRFISEHNEFIGEHDEFISEHRKCNRERKGGAKQKTQERTAEVLAETSEIACPELIPQDTFQVARPSVERMVASPTANQPPPSIRDMAI